MNPEKLIELVQKHACLYDFNNKFYHDAEKKEEIWSGIGEKLNQSAKTCKKQWTQLRDCLRRSLRKRRMGDDPTAIHMKKWKYEDEMYFLRPYLKERAGFSSLHASTDLNNEESQHVIDDTNKEFLKGDAVYDDNSTSVQSNESTSSDHIKQKRRRKKKSRVSDSTIVMKYLLENNNRKSDEVETLFYSLAQTVKKMQPYYRAIAKAKVCSVVSKLELENLTHPVNTVSCYASTSAPNLSPAEHHTSHTSIRASTPISSASSSPHSRTKQEHDI